MSQSSMSAVSTEMTVQMPARAAAAGVSVRPCMLRMHRLTRWQPQSQRCTTYQ